MTLQLTYQKVQARLELTVTGSGHSVADLLTTWQPLCDDTEVFKQFAAGHHAACVSCVNNCCHFAYVTLDSISLRRMAKLSGVSLSAFAERYLDAEKLALGIPVLRRPCPWLSDQGRCRIYEARSLLCRFYICTPLEGSLEQLIYGLTLVGMLAAAEELGQKVSAIGQGMTSFDRLNLQEMAAWAGHPGVRAFRQAADYDEVPLDLFLGNDFKLRS